MQALNSSMITIKAGDSSRATKLSRFFNSVIRGERTLKSIKDGDLFIESLCGQSDPATGIEKVISQSQGLSSIQACMRLDVSTRFLNGQATTLLQYIQDPTLKAICGGDFLQRLILHIAEPPIFWNAFVRSYREGSLSLDAQQCFGWLLLELISLPPGKCTKYQEIARETSIQGSLLNSPQFEIRTLGQKIKHILSAFESITLSSGVLGPGGRHDNDFVDFRQISIPPTADELTSTEPPFLRVADGVEDLSGIDNRLAAHLDNQFRLYREDMLGEMREELQIALGKKKGRHKGIVMDGFTILDIDCGTPTKRRPWGLKLQCKSDVPQLVHVKTKNRRAYLEENRNIFKHQSLACLILDTELAAFPTIHRDIELLEKVPPVVTLQFVGEMSTSKALLKLKTAKVIRLVQIDTAVFSYEPILRRLQELNQLPLIEELVFWSAESSINQPVSLPTRLIESIEANPEQDLQVILKTPRSIQLDDSQTRSLISGLRQRVSLIQGPPGTGKSFIGALIAKTIIEFSKRTILVVTYTNHALDQFLEDLLDIGIPQEHMMRIGGKSTPRTKPLGLYEQSTTFKQNKASWTRIEELRTEANQLADRLQKAFDKYRSTIIQKGDIMEYLEFLSEGPPFCEAFTVPQAQDGMTQVGKRGKSVNKFYLLDRWSNGQDAGIFSHRVLVSSRSVWEMVPAARYTAITQWREEMLKEQVSEMYQIADAYNASQGKLDAMFNMKNEHILNQKRIIGCTTTAAAKYSRDLQAASRDVLLVEEAGEILESHILTALGPKTQQLVLIGDHKQLRPKVNNYLLSVEKGEGYDLNRSLFERLILKGYPHQTLSKQHRMRPEISALVRSLTYPDLVDAPKTLSCPDLRGFQDNLIFVNHTHPEDENREIANEKDMTSLSSKRNLFEAEMVLKCVRYLAQQGYGTEKLVVLTPYLGQLQLLRTVLSKENDPILNDLDSFDLVRAGLMPAASAKLSKRSIKLSTIDNYQGEESEIVIITLTRSNASGDIGFMASPERLNVLLSRARDALIMIGNAQTFLKSKGKNLWSRFFGLLTNDGHIYDGFPVKCDRHKDRVALLRAPIDFGDECPDGGCKEPCGVMLSCGIHQCPQKCHQLSDHSKMACEHVLSSNCPKGHIKRWKCHTAIPIACPKCEKEAKDLQRKVDKVFEEQRRRDREAQGHLRQMAELQDQMDVATQNIRDIQLKKERAQAIEQKQKDIVAALASAKNILAPTPTTQPLKTTEKRPKASDPQPSPMKSSSQNEISKVVDARPLKSQDESPAAQDWQRQKDVENASNDAIDSIMGMIGLEDVKSQVLRIKAKVDLSLRQGTDVKGERFNVALLGNPGTGKTTVARLYAKALTTLGVLPGLAFVETTGSRLANEGVNGIKKHIEDIHNAGGGALFVDESYQLTDQHNLGGRQVLDFLLAEMENNIGKIVFIVAGYNKEMEKFFEHNPGLNSRVPYRLQFADYEDEELLQMLGTIIDKKYGGKMEVADGKDGLYLRIVARRVCNGRNRPGFGNARSLQTTFARITERQAERVKQERKQGLTPDDYMLSKEDLIGPDPSSAILKSKAWEKLQKLTGLSAVKESIRHMISRIGTNYKRELAEQSPIAISLNRVFLGSPGTGKTSVAKLYGQILADLGLLSNGEVVIKNPSDFIGSVLGQSEQNTKAILATTVGKILVIDEFYGLYSGNGGTGNQSDSFKTAVIDTIVAEVQSSIGEDRCVLLLGYKDQITTMFENVNPGLSRRFAIDNAFNFEDFTDQELLEILELKLKLQDLAATEEAKSVAIEVLSRARVRPNFGNAGEVENLLSSAKGRWQTRQSAKLWRDQSFNVIFEPQDFDPDFDRGSNATTNLQKLFEDVVGCEGIIAKLGGYQQMGQAMKARGICSRGMIPTNFLFKGPPGTGKTTTARKMGQVYYDMGFLSSVEVIESSASELIGQFIGQTGPKTRAVLEKALGKVLLIDESYRLSGSSFGKEALDELVDLLTKPKFVGKIVVILAGYAKEINDLLSLNPGLSSRFPEEIIFPNMSPECCLQILERSLKQKEIEAPALRDIKSPDYKRMVRLLKELASTPNWGNARDIQTLAKTMIGSVYKAISTTTGSLSISSKDILTCTRTMLTERQGRAASIPSSNLSAFPQQPAQSLDQPPPAKHAVSAASATAQSAPSLDDPESHVNKTSEERDPGVSDQIWNQLQADKQAADRAQKIAEEQLQRQEQDLILAKAREAAKTAELARLAQQKAKDDAEMKELKRQREESRLQEQMARVAREHALAKLKRVQMEQQKRREQEAKAQQKLREMGVCPMGYRWIKQGGGYRCAAGSHWVSDGQLGI